MASLHAQPERYDILLRGGTILDGTGAPAYQGDVAIYGGAVARVGDLWGAHAALELDVSGLYVTPGFINLHSHATPPATAGSTYKRARIHRT